MQSVERIQPRIAAVSDYARNEPTKAVLDRRGGRRGLMALAGAAGSQSRGRRP
jgi:hypothetical protein